MSSRAVLCASRPCSLLAAAVWTFHDIAWSSVWRALSAARPGWMALAAALNLVAIGFQAARWLALVRPLAPAATFASAFQSLVTGLAFSLVVPARAGELVRVRSLSRRTGLAPATVAGTVFLDFLANAAGLLVAVGLLLLLGDVPPWVRPGGLLALSAFALGGVLVWALRSSRGGGLQSSQRWPLKAVAGFLSSARDGLSATGSARALSLSLGCALASWAVEVAVVAVAMASVGIQLPLSAAAIVLLAVNLALAYPVAPPGNLGTLEVGAAIALLGFGVTKEQALGFGLAYHFLQIVPIATLGVVFASRGSGRGASAPDDPDRTRAG